MIIFLDIFINMFTISDGLSFFFFTCLGNIGQKAFIDPLCITDNQNRIKTLPQFDIGGIMVMICADTYFSHMLSIF
jgi:hypothetical protein